MTDNNQLTALKLLNKIEPNGELLGTDKAIEFAIEYSAQQNAELIKQIEQLSGVIDSQKQTADSLIKKCNEIKISGDKMAEQLKIMCKYLSASKPTCEALEEWNKLNK